MPLDEATVIRYLLIAVAAGVIAYGLWWFLFRRPPRPRRMPVFAKDV